jgi:hypothetical protein
MLEIRTAAELIDPELEARWAARRADRASDLMQYILRTFVERGGPIAIDEVVAACPDEGPDAVRRALVALDEQDLIQIRDGRIEIAYPFSASPTPFVVRLDGGRERYACCAIDALGMAPMLGETVGIRSRCHHSGEPVELVAEPAGPARGGDGLMVWVGTGNRGDCRLATGL